MISTITTAAITTTASLTSTDSSLSVMTTSFTKNTTTIIIEKTTAILENTTIYYENITETDFSTSTTTQITPSAKSSSNVIVVIFSVAGVAASLGVIAFVLVKTQIIKPQKLRNLFKAFKFKKRVEPMKDEVVSKTSQKNEMEMNQVATA